MSDRHAGRDRQRLTASVTDIGVVRQRALVIAIADDRRSPAEVEASLREIERLVDTAGSDVVEEAVQRRGRPDPATYIGRGKADELAGVGAALDIDLVVVDGELSPVQQRNLQEIFGVDVVDRVALILDIFALHATSRAGMAQVELAMLRYRLPRLRGRGVEMSRLGAGIGTRGPGETKLESDRRRVLRRISQLEDELEHLVTVRNTQRRSRERSAVPALALVGYTNAGKSSLLNRITGSRVLVEDRLFSTLDSTVRRLTLPGGREAVLSDTVGFVRDLPHTLVESFRSTLEEVSDSQILLHVADASVEDSVRQIEAVRDTLGEIGAGSLPEILVVNKTDIASPVAVERLLALNGPAVAVSAATGAGVSDLLGVIEEELSRGAIEMDLLVPFDRGDVVDFLHRYGEIITEAHDTAGTRLRVLLPERHAGAVEAMRVGK